MLCIFNLTDYMKKECFLDVPINQKSEVLLTPPIFDLNLLKVRV